MEQALEVLHPDHSHEEQVKEHHNHHRDERREGQDERFHQNAHVLEPVEQSEALERTKKPNGLEGRVGSCRTDGNPGDTKAISPQQGHTVYRAEAGELNSLGPV